MGIVGYFHFFSGVVEGSLSFSGTELVLTLKQLLIFLVVMTKLKNKYSLCFKWYYFTSIVNFCLSVKIKQPYLHYFDW